MEIGSTVFLERSDVVKLSPAIENWNDTMFDEVICPAAWAAALTTRSPLTPLMGSSSVHVYVISAVAPGGKWQTPPG